jgi:hypothetical protein
MKRLSLKLLILLALLTITGLVPADSNDTATLDQIAGYRQWTRVNQKPVVVDVPIANSGATLATLASAGG